MRFKLAKCIFCGKYHFRITTFGSCFAKYLNLDMKQEIEIWKIIKNE